MVELAQRKFVKKAKTKSVTIRNEYRAGNPFALKSRLAVALVFGFMANSEEVSNFMQKASHSTRAYFVNAKQLKGFVIPFSITEFLKKAQENNQLSKVARHQRIDMDALCKTLDQMKSTDEKYNYLSIRYPGLYVFVLQERGMKM